MDVEEFAEFNKGKSMLSLEGRGHQTHRQGAVRWSPPQNGKIKINGDGSFDKICSPAGAGGLATNQEGQLAGPFGNEIKCNTVSWTVTLKTHVGFLLPLRESD